MDSKPSGNELPWRPKTWSSNESRSFQNGVLLYLTQNIPWYRGPATKSILLKYINVYALLLTMLLLGYTYESIPGSYASFVGVLPQIHQSRNGKRWEANTKDEFTVPSYIAYFIKFFKIIIQPSSPYLTFSQPPKMCWYEPSLFGIDLTGSYNGRILVHLPLVKL